MAFNHNQGKTRNSNSQTAGAESTRLKGGDTPGSSDVLKFSNCKVSHKGPEWEPSNTDVTGSGRKKPWGLRWLASPRARKSSRQCDTCCRFTHPDQAGTEWDPDNNAKSRWENAGIGIDDLCMFEPTGLCRYASHQNRVWTVHLPSTAKLAGRVQAPSPHHARPHTKDECPSQAAPWMLACRCLQSRDWNKSQLMDHEILLVGCGKKPCFVVELAIHTTCIRFRYKIYRQYMYWIADAFC